MTCLWKRSLQEARRVATTREEFDVFLLFLPYRGINILLLRQEVSTAREAEAAEGRGAGAVVSELP